MKKFLAAMCLSLLHILSPAQCTLSLSGQILDLDDGSELEGTVASLVGNSQMITDRHGRFTFGGLCAGSYSLLLQHFGCRDTVLNIELKASLHLKVKLPHSAHELQEIDIMDKRNEMKDTRAAEILDQKTLQLNSGKPLAELLKEVSGLSSFNTGASISRPMIHGMQGYRLLLLNNGIRHEGQQWGNEHAPEIDPFIAKRILVIKGANSIRYGSDAIAGVVLVEPNPLPDTAAVRGELHLAGFSNGRAGNSSILLEGNFEKLRHFSWRIQGSGKKGGDLKTPQYYLKNTGAEEYNFSYALGYHRRAVGIELYYSQFNTRIGIFRGSHISNLGDLAAAYRRSKPLDSLAGFSYDIERPYQEVTHELVKGLAHYHFSSRWRARLQYAMQYNWRKEYDLHLPKSEEAQALAQKTPQVDYRITSQTLEGIVEHDNIRSFRGMYGASFMHQQNVYLGRFFIPYYKNSTWGIFATERFVRQHWELEAGIRYDEKYLQSYLYKGSLLTTPLLQFKNVSYSGGLIWKPDTSFNLLFNGGSAWRAPAVNELYSDGIHHGVSAIERGKDDLRTEQVLNASATALMRGKIVQAQLGAYYNHFENYIFLNPSGRNELTIRGAFPVFKYNQARARIAGADASILLRLGTRVDVHAKAMLVRGWNYDAKDHLILMPADRADLQLKFKFGLGRIFTNNFIQINSSLVNRQWRVPASGDFAPPPPAYHLLGFDAGSTLRFGAQEIHLIFSATNVLNARYREYLDRFRYFADAAGVSYNIRISVPLTIYKKKN